MCGIVGYTGPRQALPLVLEGLRRLEYRGYDSAGVVVLDRDGAAPQLNLAKKAGRIGNLEAFIDTGAVALAGTTGMGHTRWATHGGPTDRNAHPHTDMHRRVAVIHNGIIENFVPLRAELEAAGIEFSSDTDTEVVAHLLSRVMADGPTAGDLPASMAAVCRGLEGAFTLVAMHLDAPETLVAARRNSPLVVGIGEDEMFVASDVAAFIAHTRNAVELGQDQLVVINPDGYQVTSFTGGEPDFREFHVDWDLSAAEKGGFEFFMDKEIEEQPAAVAQTLLGHFDGSGIVLDELRLSEDDLRTIDKVFVVACGTAYHSGLVAKYAIEHWCRIPVEVEVASEFRYRDPVLNRDTLVVAVSQSGETADTLEALRHARRQKARVLAVCNTNGSQIPRESDAVVYIHAGPEIGVASTKAFLGMLTANYLVGLALAQARGTKYRDEIAREYAELTKIPDAIATTLTLMDPVRKLAQEIATSKAILFLGRHVGYPVALEGALKLKELAYMHAEGFAAG
ncbi:MAG TPA: glutamine--fructose-6-phosphate transaminase (isomerizing), partial [Nakamurella multipartita]|nr:glutamine--fructose-6-phosphate transaminase (isomerizing) [Nakamurella multipartita]